MPHVASGGDLQAAINAATTANIADTITLDAGGTYQGNYTIPTRAASTAYITLMSVGSIPPAGTRITPASASACAKLVTNTQAPVLTIAANAHHWKFIGLEITTTAAPGLAATVVPSLIHEVEDGSITMASIPHHLTWDRCLVHPFEQDPLPWRAAVRGFLLNGTEITITECSVYDFMGWAPQEPTDVDHPLGALFGRISATHTTPVVVTIEFGSLSTLSYKTLMTFGGATGDWSGINGTKVVTQVAGNQYSLEDYTYPGFVLSPVAPGTGTLAFSNNVFLMQQVIETSMALCFVAGPGPYLIHNNFLEAYYTPLFTGGGAGTFIDPLNVVSVTSSGNPVNQVTLSGTGVGGTHPLAVGDLIAFELAQPQAVTGASVGALCRLTVATHRFPVGARLGPESGGVHITGITQSGWSDLNYPNLFWGIVVNTTQIDLYVFNPSQPTADHALDTPFNTTGRPAFTDTGGLWHPDSKIAGAGPKQWQVGRVTNIAGTVVTYDYAGHSEGTPGNGAGVPVASGSIAQFNGIIIHDLTITQNHFAFRKSWLYLFRDLAHTSNSLGTQAPHGIWESKMAEDVLFKGNVIEMVGGDTGPSSTSTVSLGLNQANQIGAAPWVTNRRWVVRDNYFKNFTFVKISCIEEYQSGIEGGDLLFENNLFTVATGSSFSIEGSDNLRFIHNTIRNLGAGSSGSGGINAFMAVSHINTNTVVRDNIANWVTYGYNVDVSAGAWAASATILKNHLINNLGTGAYPSNVGQPGDVYIEDDSTLVFVNVASADAGGDYHGYALSGASPFKLNGTDGKDPGVDFALLDAALAGDEYTGTTRLGGAFDNRIFRVRY